MSSRQHFDVLAFGAHPDDVEVAVGGTIVKLARKGLSVLLVDLTRGEPSRYGLPGERHAQAMKASEIMGVKRVTLTVQDRLIVDAVEPRIEVARLIRTHRPRIVFTTAGEGVHPDHKAVTDIVVNGVFYARLPKWGELGAGERLKGTNPHEIDRLFFGHCRMEPAWDRFDFGVDVTDVYEVKKAAIRAYESVFSGERASLLDKYSAEDRYIGSLCGVKYAEPFRSRGPLLVADPEVFLKTQFG
jgi:bacillithiol biosynthesis deacetylase BshB1